MKTKAGEITDGIQSYRRYIKTMVRDFVYAKMVADSIEHLVNVGFKMEVGSSIKIVPYNSKFQPTADKWDAQVLRLAKWFKKEPEKTITKDRMEAYIYISDYRWMDRPKQWYSSIHVYISSKNTEACEVEMVPEIVEIAKLTGFCAELEKKKYLKIA